MLRNPPKNESGRLYSTISSRNATSKSFGNRPTGNLVRGTNGSGTDGILPNSVGVSKVPLADEDHVEGRRGKEEVPTEEEETKPHGEKEIKNPKEKIKSDELVEPKLVTSLKIIESLHSLGEKSGKEKRQTYQESSSSKKATRKVNFPFEEKIYKDLIDLNINDEDLGLKNTVIKPKEITKVKEPEPVLSDYYKPKFNKEYVIKPAPPTFQMTPFTMPELPSVYEVTKRWEPGDLG